MNQRSESTIDVENVWKRFRIPHRKRPTILDNLAGILSIFEEMTFKYEEFWAIREVSFRVEHGESLGIIGPNGSGKSTLLKLIAGIMKPDEGTITTQGSVAPILELGLGFHPELTVRENALVYGVLLGLSRKEVKVRSDSILEFAGLTRFRDAQLKNLSSGMQVRLAFSIVVQTDADIFLLDEALSVGDFEFQEKCVERFRDLKNEGRTIVLVSHNTEMVRSFCEKTLYLRNGEMKMFGASEEATDLYVNDMKVNVAPKS
jgi:lipopolysaccharide transport system ATP-binding protein